MTPARDAEHRLRMRIGVFVVIVLAALALLVTSLDREGARFAQRYRVHAEFDDVAGLFVNAPVRLAGYGVGRVRDIAFLPAGSPHAVRVEIELDARARPLIRSDSTAAIHASGLLGDMYVSVARGSERAEPVPDGGVLPAVEPIRFEVLQERAARALAETADLAADVRRIAKSFEDAVDVDEVAGAVHSLAGISQQIERGDGLLHQLVYADAGDVPQQVRELAAQLRRAVRRSDQILAQVQSGQGLAHSLVYGQGPDIGDALAAITASATRLDHLLRKLDEGEGSLGALINDPSVYEDLKLLLSGAQQSALLRTLLRLSR